jgi:hypothetical protein
MAKRKRVIDFVSEFLDDLEGLAQKDTNEFEVFIQRLAKLQMVIDYFVRDAAAEAFQDFIVEQQNEERGDVEDIDDIRKFFDKDDMGDPN